MKRITKKKQNKEKAFEDFKRKHHLEQYRFFIKTHYTVELMITKSLTACQFAKSNPDIYSEITAPSTLIKYMREVLNKNIKVQVPEEKIYDISELKEFLLIERLAGLI